MGNENRVASLPGNFPIRESTSRVIPPVIIFESLKYSSPVEYISRLTSKDCFIETNTSFLGASTSDLIESMSISGGLPLPRSEFEYFCASKSHEAADFLRNSAGLAGSETELLAAAELEIFSRLRERNKLEVLRLVFNTAESALSALAGSDFERADDLVARFGSSSGPIVATPSLRRLRQRMDPSPRVGQRGNSTSLAAAVLLDRREAPRKEAQTLIFLEQAATLGIKCLALVEAAERRFQCFTPLELTRNRKILAHNLRVWTWKSLDARRLGPAFVGLLEEEWAPSAALWGEEGYGALLAEAKKTSDYRHLWTCHVESARKGGAPGSPADSVPLHRWVAARVSWANHKRAAALPAKPASRETATRHARLWAARRAGPLDWALWKELGGGLGEKEFKGLAALALRAFGLTGADEILSRHPEATAGHCEALAGALELATCQSADAKHEIGAISQRLSSLLRGGDLQTLLFEVKHELPSAIEALRAARIDGRLQAFLITGLALCTRFAPEANEPGDPRAVIAFSFSGFLSHTLFRLGLEFRDLEFGVSNAGLARTALLAIGQLDLADRGTKLFLAPPSSALNGKSAEDVRTAFFDRRFQLRDYINASSSLQPVPPRAALSRLLSIEAFARRFFTLQSLAPGPHPQAAVTLLALGVARHFSAVQLERHFAAANRALALAPAHEVVEFAYQFAELKELAASPHFDNFAPLGFANVPLPLTRREATTPPGEELSIDWPGYSELAGKALAFLLGNSNLLGKRLVTLVGFSFGASVVWKTFVDLFALNRHDQIENIVLIGAPISAFTVDRAPIENLNGYLFNVFSTGDTELRVACGASPDPEAGLALGNRPLIFDSPRLQRKVINIDYSSKVRRHAEYLDLFQQIWSEVELAPRKEYNLHLLTKKVRNNKREHNSPTKNNE